jgi:cell division protein FtsN
VKKLILVVSAFLIFFLSNCSRKVEKGERFTSKEQVDLSNANPLALFHSTEDSLSLFDSFTSYPHITKVKENRSGKTEESIKLNYFVQVGLAESYDEINQLKNKISNLFPDENVQIIYDSPFYRIVIGPYESKQKANEIFSILERKNFSSIRIRIENSK